MLGQNRPASQRRGVRRDDFVKANPLFDADDIAMISFVFDGSDKGAIIMDDISIRPEFRPGPPVTVF